MNNCHRTSLKNKSFDLNKRKLHHRWFFVTHNNKHIMKKLLISEDESLFIKELSMQDTKSFDRKDLKANARTNYYEFYVNT